EGLKIGDSIETVGKLYGKPYYDGGGYYQYLTGGVDSMFDMKIKLSINFTGGSVSAIEYRTLQDYEEEAQKN
ncbi:MAG: hypothetical protein LBS74_06675, partial [Oscillospiraceae bacterium]|nr:hypothetical protein [Oscillospiraceae bacterium]